MIADIAWIFVAISIPWSLGAAIVYACCLSRFKPPISLTLGIGYPIGMYLAAAIGYVFLAIGAGFPVRIILILAFVVTCAFWWQLLHGKQFSKVQFYWFVPGKHWLIIGATAFGLAVLLPIVVDIWLRPLFPWDAWYSYGVKARIIFETEKLPQIVTAAEWRAEYSQNSYFLSTKHPLTVPLIQAWIAGALDRWSESLINLPWIGVLVSMALLGHGIVQLISRSRSIAVLAFALILSVPAYGIHTVLAGYLETWLALCLMAFTAAAYLWLRYGGLGLLFLMLATFAASFATKDTAIAYLAAIGFGVILCGLPYRWRLGLVTIVVLCVSLVTIQLEWTSNPRFYIPLGEGAAVGFVDGTLHLPFMRDRSLSGPNPAWIPLLESLFFSRNFVLLGYFILGAGIAAIIHFRNSQGAVLLTGYALIIASMLHFIFRYTSAGEVLATGTLDLRILIPVTAIAVLMGLILLSEVYDRSKPRS